MRPTTVSEASQAATRMLLARQLALNTQFPSHATLAPSNGQTGRNPSQNNSPVKDTAKQKALRASQEPTIHASDRVSATTQSGNISLPDS